MAHGQQYAANQLSSKLGWLRQVILDQVGSGVNDASTGLKGYRFQAGHQPRRLPLPSSTYLLPRRAGATIQAGKKAAKRYLLRLLNEQDIPEQIVTDGLRSYGAAIRETPELGCSLHTKVSAAERQNNLIEQSHRPIRDRERQQRGFRSLERTQTFLFTHAEVGNLFRHTRARTPAFLRRRNWLHGFSCWDALSLSIP